MFAMVPIAQRFHALFGWQASFLLLAGVASLMMLLAVGFPGRPTDAERRQGSADVQAHSLTAVLRRASGHSGYWLLTAGFFVCGFHVAFIATHLPAFLADQQVPPLVGAWALALIGFLNIIGSYLFGALGDRYRKKYLLGLLYLARALVIGGFVFFPISSASALIFGATIGFLWLATVPLTSGMVAQIFGSRYLSTLYGIVFFSHQIGSFLGVWLGGRMYDITGSYNAVWLAAVALGVLAAVLHLPISESPALPRQQPAPAEKPG
jgi:predicted MFS family arabinose efflux permease